MSLTSNLFERALSVFYWAKAPANSTKAKTVCELNATPWEELNKVNGRPSSTASLALILSKYTQMSKGQK